MDQKRFFKRTIVVTAAVLAASRPAGPPPKISTFFFRFAFSIWKELSCPARGFTAQLISNCLYIRSKHPSLQERHGQICSVIPSMAFLGHSGSAMSPRPTAIRSAFPSFKIVSATLG